MAYVPPPQQNLAGNGQLHTARASAALGITPSIANELALAAEGTLQNNGPAPEPASILLLASGVFGLTLACRRRSRANRR
jgi:hypothetical protein